MSTDKMRDDFRAWLLEVDLLRDRQGLVPLTGREAHLMEQAWQASRAALVIELPPKRLPQGRDSAHWANIRNNTISACSRAIEAAGVRVK